MRAKKRNVPSGWRRVVIGVLTLFVTSCSKPEEVISSRVSLANQNLAAQKTQEAIEVLEKLNERYPDEAVVLEALGFAYAQGNRHAAAAASFARAADLDPASESLRQLAAEAYFRNGALNEAAEQQRLYLSVYPADVHSWRKLGEIEEQRGDLPRAVDAYLEWYRIRRSGEAAFRLGQAFRKLNNTPQAKAWLETTIKHGDAHIEEALFGLLELELEAGDLAAAERTVRQIDASYPNSLDASPLASVRQRLAAWKEADATLTQAREEQERVTRELEDLRRRQQEDLEGETAAVAATDEPPAAQQSQEPAGQSARETPAPAGTPPTETTSGRSPAVAAAEADVEPAAGAEPESPAEPASATRELSDLEAALARHAQGDIEGAVTDLMAILEADETRVDAWVELANVHRDLGQNDAAAAYLLEARRRAPESLEIEVAYLNLIRQTKSQDVYLDSLQLARNRFPANANLAFALAFELGEAEGRTARAITAYEDFMLLADPADPRRREAERFLARSRP